MANSELQGQLPLSEEWLEGEDDDDVIFMEETPIRIFKRNKHKTQIRSDRGYIICPYCFEKVQCATSRITTIVCVPEMATHLNYVYGPKE